MNHNRITLILYWIVLALLLMTACSSSESAPTQIPPTLTYTAAPPTATFTPVPPTATITPIPPTATYTLTPTQAIPLVKSADEVIGTWYVGNFFIRFDSDGTFRQANSQEALDSQPYAISSYEFDGTQMVITEISVSGVPSCGKKVGNYEIKLLENGSIRIVAIKDQCPPRAGDIGGEYAPLL